MRTRVVSTLAVAALVAAACQPTSDTPAGAGADGGTSSDGDRVTLTIESWRSDDIGQWQDEIIPAFEADHPGIEVEFNPTAPTEYDGALRSRLEGGTAGDILTCRSFDRSRELHRDGFIAAIDGLEGLERFDDFALDPWRASDGSEQFCVPVASVIHGFYYNVAAFDELGIAVPETNEDFLAALETFQQDGTYAPLAWGTADDWIATSTAFDLVGPNFWAGEEGRQALLAGEIAYTDDAFVEAWSYIDQWQPYFPSGYQSVTYEDTQQLFALGQAAIMPAGSWEIGIFERIADIEIGAFRPTRPEGQDACYINDHPDMGMGINAATDHPEEAEIFLSWIASQQFGALYGNAVPGFFPLGGDTVELDDPLAAEFVSWRADCESTARLNFEDLTAGDPSAESEASRLTVQMWNDELEPTQVAEGVQQALASWYEPQQR